MLLLSRTLFPLQRLHFAMQYSCAYLQAATITIMGIFLRKSPIFPARNDFNNILRLRVLNFKLGNVSLWHRGWSSDIRIVEIFLTNSASIVEPRTLYRVLMEKCFRGKEHFWSATVSAKFSLLDSVWELHLLFNEGSVPASENDQTVLEPMLCCRKLQSNLQDLTFRAIMK